MLFSRTSDLPWAKLKSPENLISETMRHTVSIAPRLNVNRIVTCSAHGANDSKKDIPGWFRWLINNSNIGFAYRDHERQEYILQKSSMDWTIIRPVGMTNDLIEKEVFVSKLNVPKPKMTISRLSVAKFMLQVLENGSYINEMPTISNK